MKKRLMKCICGLLLATVLLSGCGRTESDPATGSTPEESRTLLITAEEYDYDSVQVKEPGAIQTGEEYVILEYLEQADAEPEKWTEALAVFERERNLSLIHI